MAGVNLVLYFQFVFKIQNLRESKGRRSFCEKWSALRQHPPGRYEYKIAVSLNQSHYSDKNGHSGTVFTTNLHNILLSLL
jgi:hypothetical protein